jgi:hypothetical protein
MYCLKTDHYLKNFLTICLTMRADMRECSVKYFINDIKIYIWTGISNYGAKQRMEKVFL